MSKNKIAVKLAWDVPSSNLDGSPFVSAGFRVYFWRIQLVAQRDGQTVAAVLPDPPGAEIVDVALPAVALKLSAGLYSVRVTAKGPEKSTESPFSLARTIVVGNPKAIPLRLEDVPAVAGGRAEA